MIEQPVLVALYAGVMGVAIEIVASIIRVKELRKYLYIMSLLLTAFSATLFVIWYFNIPVILIGLIASYRVLNSLRVLRERLHEKRIYFVTRQTSWWLLFFQAVSVLFFVLSEQAGVETIAWLYALLLMSLLISLVMLFALNRNLKKATIRTGDRYIHDMNLPTVSVCIPARNETDDLEACLNSVLTSDYPKLEVIVLDDCSHHSTSEIIKGLARGGVRFIHGRPPKNGWLAKNQAYDVLAEHASGEVLLFLGVDVRLDKRTISALVASMSARKKDMISLLPMGLQKNQDSGLIQPMRYWWELALPRRMFNRPPALSTAWIIRREALERIGGFSSVNNTVIPESVFARELSKSDGYSFMRANNRLRLYSNKSLDDQWETALRLHYPQLKQRPEAVLILTILELVILVLPLALFILGFFIPLGYLGMLAGIVSLILGYIHYRIILAWQVPSPISTTAVFPFAVALEVIMLQLSMHKYEFGTVVWKDRNICIPVMHSLPRLPKV